MDVTPTQSSEPLDRTNGATLQIEAIEVTPIGVPLPRSTAAATTACATGRPSSRASSPREGIVGEAYAADEDATLARSSASSATRSRRG